MRLIVEVDPRTAKALNSLGRAVLLSPAFVAQFILRDVTPMVSTLEEGRGGSFCTVISTEEEGPSYLFWLGAGIVCCVSFLCGFLTGSLYGH